MKRGKLGNSSLKSMTSKRQDMSTSTAESAINSNVAEGEKRLTLRINKTGWVELNMMRIEQDRTVNALITEAINEYLAKNGKSPSA